MNLWATAKKCLMRVPLLGNLVSCSKESHVSSLQEVGTNLFWSVMPIWLSSFVILISKTSSDKSAYSLLIANIGNGELFLYASSILAPVFYMVLKERKDKKQYPSRLSQMQFVWIIMLLSAVVFVFQRINYPLDLSYVFWISILFFASSVILLYIATVYNNNLLNPPEIMSANQNEFVDRFNHRRDHGN